MHAVLCNMSHRETMKNKQYRPRLQDSLISELLSAAGAVCVEGPKWCGKTWSAEHHAASVISLGNPEGNFNNRMMAQMNPSAALEGERPHLVDEWQEVPAIWDAVRYRVDEIGERGLFLLTGSATPVHKGIMHSGAGRIVSLRMRPMSLFESGDSSGQVSLYSLTEGELPAQATGEVSLMRLIELVMRGGWPGNLGLSLRQAVKLPMRYLDAVLKDDLYRMDGVRRDLGKMKLLLRSLARNESTLVGNATLKRDIKAHDDDDLGVNTIAEYLDILARLFLTDNQPPFPLKLRSKAAVQQAEKRHLADPSLACALLQATPQKLLRDLTTFGFLFESMVERDLRVYAESREGNLYHYRDDKGKEIDAIVKWSDGRWIAVEIKLGAHEIEAAAQNLLSIQRDILAYNPENSPSALLVVCGMSHSAYKRPDGVMVVPPTALRD